MTPAPGQVIEKSASTASGRRTLVSIIVPVYNEYYHIDQVVKRILAAPMPVGVDKEIILVNDGSTDGTREVLKEMRGIDNIHVHHSLFNQGKGCAIRSGLQYIRGEVVIIQDGDHEYDPNELERLVEPIVAGTADVVYGSRFLGSPGNMRFRYWLVNKLLVAAVRVLYGVKITDEATAYKVFRAKALLSVPLNCRRFEFCPEVTAKMIRSGRRIHEVPITYRARTLEEGKKIRLWDAVEAFWTLARYRFWRP